MVSAPMRFWKEMIPQRGQARRLAVLTLTQAIGTSLFLTSGVIFFTKIAGYSAQSVALTFSVAGLCGFLSTVPVGKMADRIGARPLLSGNYAVLGVLFVLYCLSWNFISFTVVACLIAICETAGSPLRATLTYGLFGGEAAVRVRSQMRSVFNLGSLAGSGLAGAALVVGTREAFYVVLLANAAAQATCAFLTLGFREAHPRQALRSAAPAMRVSALRDYRFIAVTLASGLLELHSAMLNIAIPLWITVGLHASGSLQSAVIAINTILVLLLQVRLSRGADSAMGAARLQRRAGVVLAASCVLFAATSAVPQGWLPALMIVAAVAVMTIGEIYQAAGSWGISFELPPPGQQGSYQGVFALGRGLQQFLGPAVVTVLVLDIGAGGWLALAAVFVAVGVLSVAIVRAAGEHGQEIWTG
ncbi:MFS transporter [Streptomyces sp. NPDC053728]|uniref:MFS transporter n=1 Tax=Streptomyces sp. NPDC053728 TaxID=3155534 RepID=UPI00342FCE8E